ncbi:MAG: pyridoxal phosphate-dependent aminotransferase [Thermovirgaceae bacterium]
MPLNRAFVFEGTSAASGPARLDKNESPYDMAPAFKEELRQLLPELVFNRYPDPENRRLRVALADELDFSEENITVGNGGDEILQMLFSAFSGPGSVVLTLKPCFSQYEALCRIYGARRKCVSLEPGEKEIHVPGEKLLDALSANPPALVLLDSPNNPTGKVLPEDLVRKVIQLSGGIVVVDEAYAEFSGKSILDHFTGRPLPENLVVLRTFSKAWGLAGLRVGYAVCARTTRERLDSVKPPFNINIFSQEAALLALKYRKWMERRVASISYTRDRFLEDVNRLPGWKAYPSGGNFVLLRGNQKTQSVLETAELHGLNLKDPEPVFSDSVESGGWIRASVGREDEMERLLSFLRNFS